MKAYDLLMDPVSMGISAAAARFVELFQVKQTLSLAKLKEEVFLRHWKDESWHEVLRLIAGMVGEQQAEELIRSLLDQDGRDHKLANLMLAGGCLSEIRNRRALQKLDEVLWRRFVEEVIRYEPPYYYEDYVVWSEAGPTRQKAVGLIAFVWRTAGARAWLKSAAEGDPDWIVRWAAVRELARGWKDDPDTLSILKDRARYDEDNDVRQVAVLRELARGWKDDPEVIAILKSRQRPLTP